MVPKMKTLMEKGGCCVTRCQEQPSFMGNAHVKRRSKFLLNNYIAALNRIACEKFNRNCYYAKAGSYIKLWAQNSLQL